jgi:hypothetical protein
MALRVHLAWTDESRLGGAGGSARTGSDLLGPLSRLIAESTQRIQIFVVTHAAALIAALREKPKPSWMNTLDLPAWNWPER